MFNNTAKSKSAGRKGNDSGDVPDPTSGKILKYFREKVVYKFFWGRGSLYKTTLHASIGIVTFAILLSSVSTGFRNSTSNSSFNSSVVASANIDLLEQGASIESVFTTRQISNFETSVHTVAEGENLDDVANKYSVSKRAIIDSNRNIIDFYDENISPGDKLRIPPVDGALYKAESGDTIDSILEKFEGGTRYDLIELNNLRQPDYTIEAGQELIIAGAQLPAPPRPQQPAVTYTPPTITVSAAPPSATVGAGGSGAINGLSFASPVAHPSCAGWVYQRGFASWHNGIDLSRGGGCVLVATAPGLVNFAGWSNGGQGFMVKISHGNGLETQYFHGSGEFYVKPGQYVETGQPIMYMGSTGFSTGTHVHYSLVLDGYFIDPAPYTSIF